MLLRAGPNPPTAPELKQAGLTKEVAAYLVRRGDAVQLRGDLLISAATVQSLEAKLRALLEASPEGLSVAAVRDHLQTSRRVALPLLERLERSQLVERVGDLHRLRSVEA